MKMKRKRWSKALVIAALQERKAAGKALNYQAVVVDDERLAGAARRRFGSWDAALVAAGLDPADIRKCRTWTPDTVVAAIRTRHKQGQESGCPIGLGPVQPLSRGSKRMQLLALICAQPRSKSGASPTWYRRLLTTSGHGALRAKPQASTMQISARGRLACRMSRKPTLWVPISAAGERNSA